MVATKFLHDEGEQEEIYNDEWAEAGIFSFTSVNLTATQCRSLNKNLNFELILMFLVLILGCLTH